MDVLTLPRCSGNTVELGALSHTMAPKFAHKTAHKTMSPEIAGTASLAAQKGVRTRGHHESDSMSFVVCDTCNAFHWQGVDPAEGVATLFGAYDLVEVLEAVGAPAATVLVYRAPSARLRRRLDSVRSGHWFEVDEGLWLSHNGHELMLAPENPLVAENLLAKHRQAEGTASRRNWVS